MLSQLIQIHIESLAANFKLLHEVGLLIMLLLELRECTFILDLLGFLQS
jgi:hypothetical protein